MDDANRTQSDGRSPECRRQRSSASKLMVGAEAVAPVALFDIASGRRTDSAAVTKSCQIMAGCANDAIRW
jgi:hypothetical protein